jgi:hypothetical protein
MMSCDTCQINKGGMVKTLGASQLLSILATIWTDISMDFIVGLLKLGKNSIMVVVVDCLSKYTHFVPYHTHLCLPQFPKSSWIRFLSYMACPLPLC